MKRLIAICLLALAIVSGSWSPALAGARKPVVEIAVTDTEAHELQTDLFYVRVGKTANPAWASVEPKLVKLNEEYLGAVEASRRNAYNEHRNNYLKLRGEICDALKDCKDFPMSQSNH